MNFEYLTRIVILAGAFIFAASSCATAQSRLPLPTLGGPALWTDFVIQDRWRIQRQINRDTYRLLDNYERRIAAGTLEECYHEFDRRRSMGEIPPLPAHVVITIHGLGATRNMMRGMGDVLREQGGFSVINFGYASMHGTVQDQAVALESVIRNLHGVQEVSFVCHSMGNLIVRHLLYRFQLQANPPPVAFRRMVMISPPNHGAEIADRLGQGPILQLAAGQIIDQFAPNQGWPELERQLATPWFEFGIIAGGKGNDRGYLPGVPGDDDGLLSLQTHMLNGASDFIQTGGIHQLMPRFKSVQDASLMFLLDGHFR